MLLLKMYLTMSPLILAGISNMVFTKTNIYKKLRKPIDNNKILKDGQRVFGDNKTWIGFVSMVIFYCVFQIICGIVCNYFCLNTYNELYNIQNNTVLLNCIFGILCGLIYMILELPNSFIKRRLHIASGQTESSFKGILFFVIDQIDSLIGVMLILSIFSNIGLFGYIRYLIVGGITHIFINLILFSLKVRKNI